MLVVLSYSNAISGDSDIVKSDFDEFLIEDSNLIKCLCCDRLAVFIFVDRDMLYGLCFRCYMEN